MVSLFVRLLNLILFVRHLLTLATMPSLIVTLALIPAVENDGDDGIEDRCYTVEAPREPISQLNLIAPTDMHEAAQQSYS